MNSLRNRRAYFRRFLSIFCGPGYRVYYKDTGKEIVILLCGGDKSTQQADIARAKVIASQYQSNEKEK